MMNRCVLSAVTLFFLIYFAVIIDWSTYISRFHLFKATITKLSRQQNQFTLNCSHGNMTKTCPKDHTTTFDQDLEYSSEASGCPEHFKWIHEDLKPWKSTGITREMLESGKSISQLRIVIIQGKAYLEVYGPSFQTRDVFTIWGILQLLRLYPGKVPDLELLFETGDVPVVLKERFQGPNAMPPPPIFHYCGRKDTFDIVFPDWSFWGWAELAIRPWEAEMQSIEEGNKKVEWKDRAPYAFWKGNKRVSLKRYALTKCNASTQHDSYAHIYSLHWDKEVAQGFQNTKLADQCTHRYKIYVEGVSWSVSEKYILACDSMTLFIDPMHYDFFTRSLVPWQHYWPIRSTNQSMCSDIKYAVDWGNANPDKAEQIGKAGTRFIYENLKMNFVYDYMLHVLTEYAKLLRFKPTIPAGAVEVCSENVACPMYGIWRQYLVDSMVKSPSATPPCTMSSPYDEEEAEE